MVIDALRQWSRHSLANTFALRAASIALLSVLLVAGVSVTILLWTEHQAAEATLHHNAQTAVERVEAPLKVVAGTLNELAKSPMFATALLDSGGRAAYARPFLQNYRFPLAAANGLALCDLNGQLLAGSESLAECGADRPEFSQVLADGKPRQAWQVSNGRQQWLIYQGITFAYTGTTEGLLVARVDLDELLRPLTGELKLASVALRPSASPGDVPATTDAWPAPLFKGEAVVTAGPLELLVAAQPRSIGTKLLPLLGGYALATLMLLVVIVLRARRDSRTLIEPLAALRDRACEIAVTKDLSLPIPRAGTDEVGQLADSLAGMVTALRNAENQRRESEGRFRLIYDKSDEAILFAWPDGRIEAANPAACRLFGHSEAEFRALGRAGVMDITDPRLPAALEERGRTGTFRGELNCRHADGHIFPIEVVSTLFHDAHGTPRTSNLFRDISERKQANDALQASLDLLRLRENALGAISQGVLISGPDKLITYASVAFERVTGYAASEVLGRSCALLQGPGSDPETIVCMRAALDAAKPFHGEILNYRKDGSTFWNDLSIVPVHDAAGVLIHFVGVQRDISERKRQEEALRQSEARFRSYFELGLIGMVVVGLDKRLLLANDRFCAIVGYTHEALMGRPWTNFTHPDNVEADASRFDRVLAGELDDGYVLDTRFVRSNGAVIVVTVSAVAIRNPDGAIDHFVGMVQDITGRITAERERLKSANRLATLSRNLVAVQESTRRRLAQALHESTSPNLAAIAINLDTVALALNQRDWERIAEIEADNRGLLEDTAIGIRDICADLRPPALDYAGLVAAVETYVSQFSRRTGIAVAFESAREAISPPTEVESMLFRIVQEALTNVAKHAQATRVILNIAVDTAEIILTVSDDGCGFAPDQPTGHAGLGLITLREMAEFFGGTFDIQSSPGGGTRIHVTTPFMQMEDQP